MMIVCGLFRYAWQTNAGRLPDSIPIEVQAPAIPYRIGLRWRVWLIAYATLLLSGCDSFCSAAELMLRDGTVVAPTSLIERTPEGDFLFGNAQRYDRLTAREWITWGQWHERYDSPQLILTDGSRLSVWIRGLTGNALSIESDVWPTHQLTRDRLRELCFRPPLSMRERDRLLDLLGRDPTSTKDRLLLTQGDRLLGRFQDALPNQAPEPGSPRSIELETIWFERVAGQPARPIPVADVVAVWWQALPMVDRSVPEREMGSRDPRGPLPTKRARLLVGLRDGSLLVVERCEQIDMQVRLVLVCGAELTADGSRFWPEVTFLQPLDESVRYLSDSEPLAYRQVPFFALNRPFGRDRNAQGGRLRFAQRVYAKGVGLQGTARAVYELQSGDEQFAAEVGIDTISGEEGSVIFRVFVERQREAGQRVWEMAFQTPIVRGGEPLLPIRLDLRHAQRLALVTDSADRADLGDLANWFNARILRTVEH